MDDFQVRNHVLDLGAFVKREASDHVILQPVAAHGFFIEPRLRIGSVEDGGACVLALVNCFAQIFRNVVGCEESFVFAVRGFVVADFGAALARGPQVLAFALEIVRNHGRRRLQDVLRRTVVLLQANDLGFGKILLKLQNVADVRATPGINRLIFITHSADVVMSARQETHQFVLRTVRVLIFVNHDVLVAPVVVVANLWHGFQKAYGLKQKIVEIESVGLAQLLAIFLVNVSHTLRLGVARLQIHLLRIEHVVLGPRNMGQHGTRSGLLVVDAKAPHRRLHQLLLIGFVVDHKAFGQPDRRLPGDGRRDTQLFDVPPQHAHTERVKC